jgi:hypothetical protein
MLWLRHLTPFAILAVLTAGGLGAYQALNRQLDGRLRLKLDEELARENLRADIGNISLDPLRGLVATKFRLYGGPSQQLLLAAFDELRLDIDLGRLLTRNNSSTPSNSGAPPSRSRPSPTTPTPARSRSPTSTPASRPPATGSKSAAPGATSTASSSPPKDPSFARQKSPATRTAPRATNARPSTSSSNAAA